MEAPHLVKALLYLLTVLQELPARAVKGPVQDGQEGEGLGGEDLGRGLLRRRRGCKRGVQP